jgi:uncharacterized protein YdgA (DUF945 family)
MKKVIAIFACIAVAVAGGWVGASWYTGQWIEARAANRIADLNRLLDANFPGYGLSLKIESYQRGIFTSRMRYSLQFAKEGGVAELLGALAPVAFDARIEHGPFARSALAAGYLAPEAAFVRTELAQPDALKTLLAFKDKVPLSLDLILAYHGDAAFTWRLSPLEAANDSGSIRFGGATGRGHYVSAEQAVKMHLEAASLDVLAKEPGSFQLVLDGTTIDIDSRTGRFGLPIGQTDIKIEHVSLARSDSRFTSSLDDIHGRCKAEESDTALSGEIALEIGGIELNDIDFGGGQLVFKFRQFDGQAVGAPTQQARRIAGRRRVSGSAMDPVNFNARLENMAMLRAGNPSDSIASASLTASAGAASLAISADLKQPDQLMPMLGNLLDKRLDNPLQAVKSIDARWTLSQSAIQGLLVQWLHQRGVKQKNATAIVADRVRDWSHKAVVINFARLDGDNLVGRLHYAGQTVNLNGATMPASSFPEPLIYLVFSAIGAVGDLGA